MSAELKIFFSLALAIDVYSAPAALISIHRLWTSSLISFLRLFHSSLSLSRSKSSEFELMCLIFHSHHLVMFNNLFSQLLWNFLWWKVFRNGEEETSFENSKKNNFGTLFHKNYKFLSQIFILFNFSIVLAHWLKSREIIDSISSCIKKIIYTHRINKKIIINSTPYFRLFSFFKSLFSHEDIEKHQNDTQNCNCSSK